MKDSSKSLIEHPCAPAEHTHVYPDVPKSTSRWVEGMCHVNPPEESAESEAERLEEHHVSSCKRGKSLGKTIK